MPTVILEVSKEWLSRWKTVAQMAADAHAGLAMQLEELAAIADPKIARQLTEIVSQLNDVDRNLRSASQPF